MNKRRKQILSELKRIGHHFRLNFSKIEIMSKTAVALDVANRKLVVMQENDHHYFKTIDLQNIEGCTLKINYNSIDAGDLTEKHLDEFVERIQLQISHIDPVKSINIHFYDIRKNTVHELIEKTNCPGDHLEG
jgi:hypothetical protein